MDFIEINLWHGGLFQFMFSKLKFMFGKLKSMFSTLTLLFSRRKCGVIESNNNTSSLYLLIVKK